MQRLFLCLLSLGTLLCSLPASAQYYTWGSSPASIRWMQVNGPRGKIVYPDYFGNGAAHVISVMEQITPTMGYGFRYGPVKFPTVLHTQNFNANGIVMWAPKRMELEMIPSQELYAMPWYKQLVAHESRHTVQYGNLYKGFMRPLGWFFGQHSGLISQALLPVWLLEGDAVQAETQMSSFGRALQPSFTIAYRAYMAEGTKRFVPDKWFCGSYKDFIPDHYQLGYQITAWSRERYGIDIWDRVANYSARRPYTVIPAHWALKKYYNTSVTRMFRETFADLRKFWDSLPARHNSAQLIPTRTTSYTVYAAPMRLNDTTLLALKRDMDQPNRIVSVDLRTAREKTLIRTGWVGTTPVEKDSVLYWSEFRSSLFWDQRITARAVSYDLRSKKRRLLRDRQSALYPTPLPDGRVASVGYDWDGTYSIDFGEGRSLPIPDTLSVHGLAYDDQTGTLAFIALGDSGMSICRIDTCSGKISSITRPGYTTIFNLRAGDGKLSFNSIASGYDEVHIYDLVRNEEMRVSTSKYGSVSPSAPRSGDNTLFMTTYTTQGYLLSRQQLNSDSMQRVEYSPLPKNVVNPPREKWPVINLDTVRIDRTLDTATHHVKRYRKGLRLFNPHSWAPWSFDPTNIVDEDRIDIGLGATVMSQDLLSSTDAYLSYGYSGKGHRIRGKVNYYGLAPKISVEFDYGGGLQQLYGIKRSEADIPLKNRFSIKADVTLPMTLSSGSHIRTLTPFMQLYYLNARLYMPDGSYDRGTARGVIGLSFIDNERMGTRDILPRWGYALKFSTVGAPFRRDFGTVFALYGRTYMPGLAPHHSLMLRGNLQYQPTDRFTWYYKELYPRGANYDITSSHYAAVSADYQFPICYPDVGINSLVYFNRIRLNLYGDYARFIGIPSHLAQNVGYTATTLWSYGGTLTFDMRLVRMPKNDTSIGVYVYKPSDRKGVVSGFVLTLPL